MLIDDKPLLLFVAVARERMTVVSFEVGVLDVSVVTKNVRNELQTKRKNQ